jgi:hypothetical protein
VRAADRDLVAQDIGHLVAVAMQMERALCHGGNGFLEYHDTVAGRFAQQSERHRSGPAKPGFVPAVYNDAPRIHR